MRNQKCELRIDFAAIAQLVERTHGKGEVLGSIPSRGSTQYLLFSYLLFNIFGMLFSPKIEH